MMIFSQPLTFEILHSVDSGIAPHDRSPASATEPAGQDLWASSLPERATVPLQSRADASHFWIMFLLSSGTFEREIIEGERRDAPMYGTHSLCGEVSEQGRRLGTRSAAIPACPPCAVPR